VVDKKWRSLWQLRMSDPLKDAETMKLDEKGFIQELGKKPKDFTDIQGQYIGLIKFSASMMGAIKNFYHSLDKQAVYDGKPFDSMYMTSFLQLIIDRLCPIQSVLVHGGWLEFDSLQDVKAYESLKSVDELAE
jgi:choline kinase